MGAIRKLSIELPEDMAKAIRARVDAGQFTSESEMVECALRDFAANEAFEADPAVEEWLRAEVVRRYDAWKADPSGGMTAEEVKAALEGARQRRQAGA